jgi:hypothetical protein
MDMYGLHEVPLLFNVLSFCGAGLRVLNLEQHLGILLQFFLAS